MNEQMLKPKVIQMMNLASGNRFRNLRKLIYLLLVGVFWFWTVINTSDSDHHLICCEIVSLEISWLTLPDLDSTLFKFIAFDCRAAPLDDVF